MTTNLSVYKKDTPFRISPNPATLFISIQSMPLDATIIIQTLDGKQMLKKHAAECQGLINVHRFPKGIFLL
jgi:hypothetical protein